VGKVRVRYFASLREQKGRAEEDVDVPDGQTLAELYRALFPPGPLGAIPVAFARNQTYAAADDVVVDGDEIVFLPPLGGG
jgi:molybdopterin converting factor subunit 1